MDSDNRKCRLCRGIVEMRGSIPSWWGICTEIWILEQIAEKISRCSCLFKGSFTKEGNTPSIYTTKRYGAVNRSKSDVYLGLDFLAHVSLTDSGVIITPHK